MNKRAQDSSTPRGEQYDRESCWTCKHWQPNQSTDDMHVGVCQNQRSRHEQMPMYFADWCERWEETEKVSA